MQKNNGRHKGSCWTLIIFSSKVINFEYFAQTSTIIKLFIIVQISLAQTLGLKVQSSRLSTIHSNPHPPLICICYLIDLMLSSPILALLVCHSFLILFYRRNSRIDDFVSDTHYFIQFPVAYHGGCWCYDSYESFEF